MYKPILKPLKTFKPIPDPDTSTPNSTRQALRTNSNPGNPFT